MTVFCERTFSPAACAALERAGYMAPLARALAARGVASPEDLDQSWSGMIEPARLAGVNEAVERLRAALTRRELVTVVADYDCDGATACAVAVRGLRALGFRVDYCVPDRFTNGYGLTCALVDAIVARNRGTRLLLTVDNGMAAVEAVAYAKSLGIDTVVTDHHLPGASLPAAAALVNPNRPDCRFPSKSLAGVGVVFYVLLALRAALRESGYFNDARPQPNFAALIDLVALGTVADVVKLDKNNRILVSQGLARVRAGKTVPGIAALFAVARRGMHAATARDFGFTIGPRINAAGRMTTMEFGIECLLSDDAVQAREYAEALHQINAERREVESAMQDAALSRLQSIDTSGLASISLYDPSFNEGVIGLVASRLKERYNRPVIAFAPNESGELKGSGRSINGIHLRDMLDLTAKRLPGSILRFGGHAMAAGLSLRPDAFEGFKQTFEAVVREHVDEHSFTKSIWVDGSLAPDEINERLCRATDALIWGQGFDAPLYANEFRVVRQQLLKDAHTKLVLELGRERFDAIFFRRTKPLPARVRLAYRPEINEYNGRRSVQLVVEAAEEP